MTRDAKVGLLLGLFFIFIIAFLINGLPSLRKHTNNNELTNNIVSFQNNPPGLGAKERKVQQTVTWMESQKEPEPIKKQTPDTTERSETEEQGVRFEMLLPKSTSVVKDISDDEVKAVAAALTTEKKTEPAETALLKTYVVSDGDNLAVIAKKFYGDEEGNKMKNIEGLYQANRKVLKSPDEIFVGQKLIIPVLLTNQDKAKTESTFSSRIFEKVQSIGQRRLSTQTVEAKQDIVYIVQEGDSLWRIAAEQLGNGGRYPEISKLNAGTLEDDDSLIVGMRLRLPGP